jgi:hypothetical protein
MSRNAGSFPSANSAYAGCIHESLGHDPPLLGIFDTKTFEDALESLESLESHYSCWLSGHFVIVRNDYQFEGH